jgi:hypothetical protein
VSLLFDNPELIRNARIQLRPGRMIVAAVICAVVSVTVWVSILHGSGDLSMNGLRGAGMVFALILYLQVGILLIGGGIFCLQSVHREKELNTFDYQRVTRLTSFELAIGKLLGAPILMYFVVLCLTPVSLAGAFAAHLPGLFVAEAYVILVLGSIAFHALMLLVSMLLGRSGQAVSMLLFLMLVGFTSMDFLDAQSPWGLHRLSPFAAVDLFFNSYKLNWTDRFFGIRVDHAEVLIVLYVTFAAWFLVAVVRNLKRDPSEYEILPAPELFAFVMYVNLLMMGFLSWKVVGSGEDTVPMLLVLSWWPLWLLTLVLVRNRERVRRRTRKLAERVASWWAALWPAPYIALGAAIVGGTVLLMTAYHREPGSHWSWEMTSYYVAFLIVWLSRDALYLQWMYLRRAKYPLASAVLYLIIFYFCATILFNTFNAFDNAKGSAFTAVFIPSAFFALNDRLWGPAMRVWMIPLFLQAAGALVFAWLHKQRLSKFGSHPADQGSSAEIAESA